MKAGDVISFQTVRGTCVQQGVVLSCDGYLELPLRVEYHTESGDKRIERFSPNEFKGGCHVH